MRIDILTLFPGMFNPVICESMMKIARNKALVDIRLRDIREWTYDRHRTVDDKPFGGGPGMVMKVEPIDKALEAIRGELLQYEQSRVILMTPQGKKFDQKMARRLSTMESFVLVCGHYEGVDERVRELVDEEISIGDYVLTCGEIPAMVVCDAVTRLIPGVLGDEASLDVESFDENLLEYPQYTRPAVYRGMEVPEVLLCGDPSRINKWKQEESLKRTLQRRPDLVK